MEWERTFASHVLDRGFVLKIYKTSKNRVKKTDDPVKKSDVDLNSFQKKK